ncbi:MAG TPA: hypothetical protein VIZ62_00250 [Nitrososphaeraceae archaeon]
MLILVLALSLLMIGGLLLDKVNAEESLKLSSIFGGQESSLSTLINNALLGNVNSNSIDAISTDDVKEQYITIKEDGYNNNMIFEEPKKKMELLTSPVPFILPVPFP